MATYRIDNNEILISFDGIPDASVRDEMKRDKRFRWDPERTVWHGAFTPENEALAQRITGAIPAGMSLEEKLQMCIETPGADAKTQLADSLMGSVEEHLDEYLEFIHKTVDEEKTIQERIDDCESRIEEEKSGYESQKKTLAAKRAIVEKVIASYLNSVGEERIKGSLYNVSIKESYSYKLDTAFEEELKAKIAQILPGWIDVEFKIRKEAKQMEPKPQGIVVGKSKQSINVWSDNETEPGLSRKELDLLAFKQGKGIKEIADERGAEWKTVYNNLKKCMNDGSLDIHDFVDQATLDRIDELYNQNNAMKPYDYVRELGNRVSYDMVILSLLFLGLAHQ